MGFLSPHVPAPSAPPPPPATPTQASNSLSQSLAAERAAAAAASGSGFDSTVLSQGKAPSSGGSKALLGSSGGQ